MKLNPLGKSGIEVSSLGMGCWAYGGGSYWGEQPQKDVNDVIAMALDNGINYFDTAEVYNNGASESSLGIALRARRDEAVIGTKLSTSNAAVLEEHIDNSLRRLGTDYIDIYMLHWPVNYTSVKHFNSSAAEDSMLPSVGEVFLRLEKQMRAGKIRAVGISNHGVEQMEEIRQTGVEITVNELPYNLISRAIEAEILPYCIKNSIGVFGYMAYQQGILAGIYKSIGDIPDAQAHSRHFRQERGGSQSRHYEGGAEAEILVLMNELQKASGELGVSVAMISLSWAVRKAGISSTLVGSRNMAELEENIRACGYVLPFEIADRLDKVSLPILKKLGSSPDYYENRADSRIK